MGSLGLALERHMRKPGDQEPDAEPRQDFSEGSPGARGRRCLTAIWMEGGQEPGWRGSRREEEKVA